MSKTALLFLLLSTWLSVALGQQHASPDSIIKIARTDVKSFRLDEITWKKYRHKLSYTSDHFKPTEASVKNPALLSDSVYVHAYRREAFKRNKKRHTPWHYVLVGGSIAAGTCVALVAAILIFVAPTMG